MNGALQIAFWAGAMFALGIQGIIQIVSGERHDPYQLVFCLVLIFAIVPLGLYTASKVAKE